VLEVVQARHLWRESGRGYLQAEVFEHPLFEAEAHPWCFGISNAETGVSLGAESRNLNPSAEFILSEVEGLRAGSETPRSFGELRIRLRRTRGDGNRARRTVIVTSELLPDSRYRPRREKIRYYDELTWEPSA